MLKPKLLLHIEGVAVLFTACLLYQQAHRSWLWFGLLLLVPDFSMLGYLANLRLGAVLYNLAHTYTLPLLWLSTVWLTRHDSCAWLAFIWLAHIGMDRLLGYGLKYDTAFRDTHLQRV
jgi:hypothetical protein